MHKKHKEDKKMSPKQRKILYIGGICLLTITIIGIVFCKSIFIKNKNNESEETVNHTEEVVSGVIENKNAEEENDNQVATNNNTANNLNNNQNQSTPTTTPKTTNSTRPFVSPMNKEVSQGSTTKSMIALTFDAGASAIQAPAILKILRENNVQATFFLTGKWAEQNPTIVRQIVDDGNTLGNHTYSHRDLITLSDDEIRNEFRQTETIITNIAPTAVLKPYFRPPYGSRNDHVRQVAADEGYQSIYWSTDALDWLEGQTYKGSLVDNDFVKKRIFDNAKNGAIFLIHIGDDITPAILQDVITELKNRNYQLVTLEVLLK